MLIIYTLKKKTQIESIAFDDIFNLFLIKNQIK